MTIDAVMEAGIREGVFPGAVLLFSRGDQILFHRAYGQQSLFTHDPVTLETCFDLASLTKPLATALAVAKLVEGGALTLEQSLGSLVDCRGHEDKQMITIDHLLRHTGGFPAHRPFYPLLARMPEARRRQALRRFILAEPLIHCPGTRQVYSDLGYMVLAWVVESTTRMRLDLFVDEILFTPLGLDLFFRPLGECDVSRRQLKAFAATELCPWRGRILTGEVHDDNAWAAGGVEGHAGLFGTAHGVGKLLFHVLAALHGTSTPHLPAPGTHQNPKPNNPAPSTQNPEPGTHQPNTQSDAPIPGGVLRRFVQKEPGRERVAGFDTPSLVGSSAGGGFSTNALGHLGYTGTSFWVEPDSSIIVVLLTNRVHPSRDNIKIRHFRPRLHDAVMGKIKSDHNRPVLSNPFKTIGSLRIGKFRH
jgi:CubicO group peptidase (beta-lactamase class C family)